MEDIALSVSSISSLKQNETAGESKTRYVSVHTKKNKHQHIVLASMGTFGVMMWIVLFSLGMLIDSSPYRDTLSTDFTWVKFFMTMLTFTPSNIAILCLVSAFIGGCTSLMVITKVQKDLELDEDNSAASSKIYMNENPFSSMLRGMLVYFAFLAGVFITSSNALSAPTAQAYTQAAGVVSMLAFLVGYDPTMFRTLMNISEKLKSN